ncbi:MAG: WYL domain-containing transcriptional regulator [Chthoniobacterales bacterium]
MKYIYERLKTQRRPNCSVLAEALEVSPKTIQRDIDFMRYQLDLPIEYDQVQHGFFFNGQVAQFPSIHITEAELIALLVARKALEQYADTPFQKPLAAAFHKLTTGLENEIAFNWQDLERTFNFRPVGFAKRDLAAFEIIASAVRERRELEFDYRKLEAERAEPRRVQPFSLLCVENQWYLRAYDRMRRDLRTFHLARIGNPKMLSQRFEHPRGFDVTESFVNSVGVYAGSEATEVVLNFRDWAARVAVERTWHPSQKIRERNDKTIEMKLRVAITPEFERWLWSWGDAVEVVKPLVLRDRVKATYQRAAMRNR